jgi:hypothetical protein
MDVLDKIKAPYERIRATAQQTQDLVYEAMVSRKPVFFGTWMPTDEKFYILSESALAEIRNALKPEEL